MVMKANIPMRYLLAIPALCAVLLASGCVSMRPSQAKQWFRGNTHAHTIRSDGDSAPEVVAKWYHDHNYNFLVITDHNKFVDPREIKLPDEKRDDFLLIPGEEITGSKAIHTTAMNITNVASWKFDHTERSEIIQYHVDQAMAAGGQAVLNHPNFKYAASAEDILPVRHLSMFELFNGHPSVHNHGDSKHPSTEAMWDHLLTEGMKIFAVSSDDTHHLKTIAANKANPGRGWVMVHAASLDPDAITRAMLQGDFYASNGVFLKTCERGPRTYLIEVDAQKTRGELTSLPALRGKPVENGSEGFRIEFIGPAGKVLDTIKGEEGRFQIDGSIPYVRAKATFTRAHPDTGTLEEYYAWGQPVFTDASVATKALPGNSDRSGPLAGRSVSLLSH
ncbi:MAG: PHP domain-containing protein [Verrucomicrobia bacterium]|nr:PHP domain-containing protein [Verrucomicrobiota bacterium]MBT7067218.1 PHP domain-containing protein [Verrucomicrobiota bacterium]MBT7702364.1 PHP domain-containing protein [Verrucomicrobiota bacterium]